MLTRNLEAILDWKILPFQVVIKHLDLHNKNEENGERLLAEKVEKLVQLQLFIRKSQIKNDFAPTSFTHIETTAQCNDSFLSAVILLQRNNLSKLDL